MYTIARPVYIQFVTQSSLFGHLRPFVCSLSLGSASDYRRGNKLMIVVSCFSFCSCRFLKKKEAMPAEVTINMWTLGSKKNRTRRMTSVKELRIMSPAVILTIIMQWGNSKVPYLGTEPALTRQYQTCTTGVCIYPSVVEVNYSRQWGRINVTYSALYVIRS